MKKEKRIEIRVSNSFYDMLTKVCEQLECSKTDYLIECALSPTFIKIYREPWEDKVERDLGSMSNNLNQMARALNEIKIKIKEHEYMDQEFFSNFLNDLAFDIQEVRVSHTDFINDLIKDEKNTFHFVNSRELLSQVIEVLEDTDQEYLEFLKKRENGI